MLAVTFAMCCSCATVSPPLPRGVSIRPDPVDFQDVFVGDRKTERGTLLNLTANALNVGASTVQAGTPFAAGAATPNLPANVPANLPGGTPLGFAFDFQPTDPGNFTANWTIKIDGTDYTLDLRGKGMGVEKSVQGIGFNSGDAGVSETDGIDFGSVVVRTKQKKRLEVLKSGANLIVKIPFQITEQTGNPQTGAFRLTKPTAPPATLTLVDPATMRQLAGNERRAIGTAVEFKPAAAGTYKATLIISDSNGATAMRIFLKGIGVPPPGGTSGD